MKRKGYTMKELFKEVHNAAAGGGGGENFVKPNKRPQRAA